MATTLSIVAVFVPVAFMGGIIGRFFFQFGLTVAWAVLVSLFVSFTLTPMLAAWWAGNPHTHGVMVTGTSTMARNRSRGPSPVQRLVRPAHGRLPALIQWALRHRKSTLAIAAASFVGAFMLFPFIGGGFIPDPDNSEFVVQFETPKGPASPTRASKARELSAAINGLPGVAYTYTTVGAGATGTVDERRGVREARHARRARHLAGRRDAAGA